MRATPSRPPARLVDDRGYHSDALDEELMTRYSIEMIVRHRLGPPDRAGYPIVSVERVDARRSEGLRLAAESATRRDAIGVTIPTKFSDAFNSPEPGFRSGAFMK
jgi:hypothetical protein